MLCFSFALFRFAASNDYFAGAFFTLVPHLGDFEAMLDALAQGGNALEGRYVYGEQDFLVSGEN